MHTYLMSVTSDASRREVVDDIMEVEAVQGVTTIDLLDAKARRKIAEDLVSLGAVEEGNAMSVVTYVLGRAQVPTDVVA